MSLSFSLDLPHFPVPENDFSRALQAIEDHDVGALTEALMWDPEVANRCVFHAAIRSGHPDLLRVVLDAPVAPRLAAHGWTLLTEPLVRDGMETRYAPVALTASFGHFRLVEILVDEYGAELAVRTTPDSQGEGGGSTAVHAAALSDQALCAVQLLERWPDVFDLEDKNDEGLTALHVAVLMDLFSPVEALLDLGASPDTVDRNGVSALAEASPRMRALLERRSLQRALPPAPTPSPPRRL